MNHYQPPKLGYITNKMGVVAAAAFDRVAKLHTPPKGILLGYYPVRGISTRYISLLLNSKKAKIVQLSPTTIVTGTVSEHLLYWQMLLCSWK